MEMKHDTTETDPKLLRVLERIADALELQNKRAEPRPYVKPFEVAKLEAQMKR